MPWTVRKEMDLYCGIINGIPWVFELLRSFPHTYVKRQRKSVMRVVAPGYDRDTHFRR